MTPGHYKLDYASKLLRADPLLFCRELYHHMRQKPQYEYDSTLSFGNLINDEHLLAVAQNFNLYRQYYADLTFDDLKLLNAYWYQKYPEQKHFAYLVVASCLKKLFKVLGKKKLDVAEMGGYQGELAFEVFNKFPLNSWRNYEIIPHRKVVGLKQFNYQEIILAKPLWLNDIEERECDMFVMSDTIEHFTDKEADKIFSYLEDYGVKSIFIKSPLAPDGQTWINYHGSHLLTMGSNQLKERLAHKFRLAKEVAECYFWIKK